MVFKVIAFFLLFYFGFKFLGRILMPFMNKSGGNNPQGNSRSGAQSNRSEGDVTIEYTKSQTGKKNKGGHIEGEYVDFEELD